MKIKRLSFLLLIIFSAVFFSACQKKTVTTGQEANTVTSEKKVEPVVSTPETNGKMTTSIKDLLGKGKDLECTWSLTEDGSTNSGQVYISGSKFMTESKIEDPANNLSQVAYSMTDGEWMYIWSNESTEGMKMNMKEMEKMGQEASEGVTPVQENQQTKEAEFYNDRMDYNCKAWQVDNSKFVLPTNINFVDFGAAMEGLMESAKDMQTSMCDMCERLSGEAKTSCQESCQ